MQVSVPDLGDRLVPALATMYESLRPVLKGLNLWQVICTACTGVFEGVLVVHSCVDLISYPICGDARLLYTRHHSVACSGKITSSVVYIEDSQTTRQAW